MNWVEKYAPQTTADLVGHTQFKADAKGWKETGLWPPAILLHGSPGMGKTTAAHCIARDMLGEYCEEPNLIITNSSDDRGIDYIRELKHTVKTSGLCVKRKVIILDEADGLTSPAQDALRHVMEAGGKYALFILTANDSTKIKKAIQSRCNTYRFEFKDSDTDEILERLLHIVGPQTDINQLKSLIALTNYDLRKCITALESSHDNLDEYLRHLAQPLSDMSVAAVTGDYAKLRFAITQSLAEGHNRISILRGLRYRVRQMLEDDEYYSFMLTWGEFMEKAMLWGGDDASFMDYFIAKLRAM